MKKIIQQQEAQQQILGIPLFTNDYSEMDLAKDNTMI